jgi:hypothetical protein
VPDGGIITYLTEKHGGNVHTLGIVTITSNSDCSGYPRDCGPENLADFTSSAAFWSNGGPNKWICWDFHEMRVDSFEYAVIAHGLTSWVLEGSLDGAALMWITSSGRPSSSSVACTSVLLLNRQRCRDRLGSPLSLDRTHR